MNSQGEIPEVSTTMKCTISLTIQYMLVYTALGICRSRSLDITGTGGARTGVLSTVDRYRRYTGISHTGTNNTRFVNIN